MFEFPLRIYYEDTDAGGVVYHARYLHFFERARTEYLRALGFTQQPLLAEQKQAFVVRKMEIDFYFPAKLDEQLKVQTKIVAVKGSSILFEQQLLRDQVKLCAATSKIAYVDLIKMKPIAIPMEIKAKLIQYL
ncbi:tol-pal system-associated acyl-CoA thioesterase [Volucribacter amazonae]|uniref:Tol-pal system-associated acyl-CoA thioesterase n=1 Tax=Volucribacter amazonae TaxID=256731 RepID=A0A9X4PB82_9PAST|nr:tol-pal system-associated acyl-CoA thioesterase [Volucribacter amazonae]MDG6895878.1 tol-pal system-associated acyl-CoA thioesterase [Volucribacter amazonae]